MQSSLKFSQSFFTRRYKAEFETSFNLEKNLIPALACKVLAIIQNTILISGSTQHIENFQGIADDSTHTPKLFTLRGLINIDSVPTPYELTLETEFKEYRGKHATIYTIKERRVNLPAALPLDDVCRVPGLTPHEMVFSLEHLRSRAFIPLLGYFPVVEERLSLSLTPSVCALFMYAENLRDKKTLPFYDHPILVKISEALEEITGESIIQEYQIAAEK